ncbi:MAG: TorD/DmsD family molecular chaperone [Rhodospirillales bacterium]
MAQSDGSAGQVTAGHDAETAVSEEDALRARFYGLLARMLAAPVDADLLEQLKALGGDDSDIGQAFTRLAEGARDADAEAAEDAYNHLFVGQGAGGTLMPYASFYRTGFLYEWPLARVRDDLSRLGVAHARLNGEPEDHIGFLCECMHGLITGSFGVPSPLADQQAFFDAHIAPWAGAFFEDLEKDSGAGLLAPVGTLGRLFMGIERDAFRMAA